LTERAWKNYYRRIGAISASEARSALAKHLIAFAKEGVVSVDRAMQTKFDEAVGRFEQQAVRNGIAVLREKGSGRLCSFGEPRKNLVDLFA